MIIRKILNKLLPSSSNVEVVEEGKKCLNNEMLRRELVEHFRQEMDFYSVGRRVLYPMSFNILMHKNDYDKLSMTFPFILPEIIASFYEAIKQKSKNIRGCDKTSPMKFWYFQFASTNFTVNDGVMKFIDEGDVITLASLSETNVGGSNISEEQNVHVSFKCANSKVDNNNIRLEAIRNIDILGDGVFRFKFDINMNEDIGSIEASRSDSTTNLDSGNVKAVISYSSTNGKVVHYSMTNNNVIISGISDPRHDANIFKIDSPDIINCHVEIRYQVETKKFQICAYAKTRLNMRELQLSIGGNTKWYDMSQNSKIFLNDALNLEFKANVSFVNR